MPPKLKKLGRPLGSKNKNTKIKKLNAFKKISIIKQEKDNNLNENGIIGENEPDYGKKALFNCKQCPNKNFKFEKKYQEHILLEHSTLPGSVGCKQCHIVCPDQDTLDIHISKIHERDVYKCAYCDKEFVRQAHVLRHMSQKGCDGSQVASFPCEICDAKFTRKDNLIVHLRQMHIKKTFFRCKQTNCTFQSKNFTKLIRHWHATHAEVPHQFECDICGKSTMSRAAMAKHLEIHGDKKYACDVCGYSTYTIEVMRRHILTHVEDKPYKCDQCNSSYIQRAQLERHLERHLISKCNTCHKEFNCKIRFSIHQRRHKGHVKLECTFKDCQYSKKEFPTEDKLVAHMNTHMDTKIYSCEVCNKPFHSEMNMRRHLNTHTLDRPRRCMYCVSARAYVRGQQLVRHVRKFHPDVFASHLQHVRDVLKSNHNKERVSKSEMDSILNVLDAESERILEGYGHTGVLYGGMQTQYEVVPVEQHSTYINEEDENNPLMSEEVLAENLTKLLMHLIDEETLQCLGWPDESIDVILEKVIEQCGAKPADREMWSRVQRLRENAKHLFLYVVDDKSVSRMLGTHTIDQIVKHLLAQAAESQLTLAKEDDCKPSLAKEDDCKPLEADL